MLHKQYWKRYITVRYYNENSQVSTIFWMSRMVNSNNGTVFLILFTFQESWRTSDPVLSRDCGSRLQLHPWRLSSEAPQLLQRWGLPCIYSQNLVWSGNHKVKANCWAIHALIVDKRLLPIKKACQRLEAVSLRKTIAGEFDDTWIF